MKCFLFHGFFLLLDHSANHLAADGSGLGACQVAVIALLQVNAHLVGGLHLKLIHGLAGIGDDQIIRTLATSVLKRSSAVFASGTSTLLDLPEFVAMISHLHYFLLLGFR